MKSIFEKLKESKKKIVYGGAIGALCGSASLAVDIAWNRSELREINYPAPGVRVGLMEATKNFVKINRVGFFALAAWAFTGSSMGIFSALDQKSNRAKQLEQGDSQKQLPRR